MKKLICLTLYLVGLTLAAAPKQLLILGQKPDGHPPGTHEYMPGARVLKALLAHRQDLRTTIAQADNPWSEGPALIAKADGIVMFLNEGGRFIQDDPKWLKINGIPSIIKFLKHSKMSQVVSVVY